MKRWLKRIGVFFGVLVVIAVGGYGVVHALAGMRLARHYRVTHETVAVPDDAGARARGRHLVEAIAGCADCHAADLGGKVMVDNAALGRLVAPNITAGRGGRTARYRVEDWVRTLRHAVDPTGRALIVMPGDLFQSFSAEDLGALIAYLETVAPVDRDLGASRLGPLGRVLFVAGKLPLLPAEKIDHDRAIGSAPPAEVSVGYGRYLVSTSGCAHCHGERLEGGPMPGAPPGTPVPPRIVRLAETGWSLAAFKTALRDGKRPDGRTLGDAMPWRNLGRMSDVELEALWLYLNAGSQGQI